MKDELPQFCNTTSNTLMYCPEYGVTSDFQRGVSGYVPQTITTATDYGYIGNATQLIGPGIGGINQANFQDQLKKYNEDFKQSLGKKEIKKMATARIVKVIIVDPDTNLPLDKRIIHKGDEIFTDLTDQELFFELNLKDLLVVHNLLRASTKDKKASVKQEKDVFLDPVRIRDLKMLVTVLAEF